VSVPLYLLVSGDVLYLGLAVLVLGLAAGAWQPAAGRVLACVGLVLVLVSSVPLHPAVYAVCALSVVAWLLTRNGSQRKQRAITVGVLAAVAAVCVSALRRDPDSLSTTKPVFVLGDSLSAGLGAATDTWPHLLALQRRLSVSNLARAGARLADGVGQTRAIPHGPATVLIELGGNDLLGEASPARFDTDLRALLAAVVSEDRHVLMFELPLLPLQNSFGRIQRNACEHYGVALLPRSILAGAVTLPGNVSDGLHLTPKGHAWLARRVSALWDG
jgi:acyl-CoA thioesterase I